MKEYFKTCGINIKDFFSNYFIAIAILIGIILMLSSAFHEQNVWTKLFYSIGSISLTGGVFAGITKSNQFISIIKKVLRDIIYANEHLEKRNDLEEIWENVTKVLSNKKFSKISSDMNKNIKKYFLPLEHDYYYDEFVIELLIDFDKDDNNYLIIKESTKFNIITEDENLNIRNKFISSTKVDIKNQSLSNYKLNKLTINGQDHNKNFTHVIDKNYMIFSYEVPLTGKKKYHVVREDVKKYNKIYNPIKSHMAVWVYNNLKVDITYPKELDIEIRGLGLLNDLKIEDKSTNYQKRTCVDYKGLIYKNQGILIHFK